MPKLRRISADFHEPCIAPSVKLHFYPHKKRNRLSTSCLIRVGTVLDSLVTRLAQGVRDLVLSRKLGVAIFCAYPVQKQALTSSSLIIMSSVPSGTTWGSPTATKHALLIHGLSSSSHTWHRVASSLAAQGTIRSLYLITALELARLLCDRSQSHRAWFQSITRPLQLDRERSPSLSRRKTLYPRHWSFFGCSHSSEPLSASPRIIPDRNRSCRSFYATRTGED